MEKMETLHLHAEWEDASQQSLQSQLFSSGHLSFAKEV
jgi:hypothetical protein